MSEPLVVIKVRKSIADELRVEAAYESKGPNGKVTTQAIVDRVLVQFLGAQTRKRGEV